MSEHEKEIKQYCNDVLKGKIKACRRIKQAVKRYLNDLKRTKDEDFQYDYRPDLVDDFLDFAENLKIADIDSEDKKLKLLPWQKWVYSQLIGFVYKLDNSIRRFRKTFLLVSRKNGKTTGFLFPLLLYDFLTIDAAESYLISGDGKQAEKTFKELLYVVKADPDLVGEITNTAETITLQNSRISFFSSETGNLDSYKPSIALIDEYWNYDSPRPVTSMEYGMRARKNGQVVIITSAGPRIDGPAYEEYQRACKLLDGKIENDRYLAIIYQIDEEDEWTDPSVLIKANPSMGDFLREEELLKDLHDAIEMPSNRPEFQSKTLGRFVFGTASWLPIEKWERNKAITINEEELKGRVAYGGLDLSISGDYTAYTLYFKLEDGKCFAKHRFYIPENTVRERFTKENINILSWIPKYLTVIPGDTIDFDFVFRDILEDSKLYDIREIAYDKWKAEHTIIKRLEEELYHIITVKMSQNLESLSGPTQLFGKAVKDGFIIDNNPVMAWMVGNVIIKPDANGNYKPLKDHKSSTDRIDGVISSIMAFSRLKANEDRLSNYSTEEILMSI